ncbi:apolipoprotein D-like [Alosa pseudoharengus]|uniref:apolipoprotein D-like n=1 Tax=Alosa pseudoharengus TaxID=34774 RepID=UPI003F8B7920
MQAVRVLLLTLCVTLGVGAQSLWEGRCPVPPVQQDFNIAQYSGRWYGIQKLPAVFQKGKCSQATYTLQSDGLVKVLNQGLLPDGEIANTRGTARVADLSDPAKLEVTFTGSPRPRPYWVLATDYDSYALVYSCTNTSEQSYVEFAWIMSRTRSLPADTITELKDKLHSHGIKTENMTVTDQSGCSSMPV